MKQLLKTIQKRGKEISAKRLNADAAYATLYLLISMFPLTLFFAGTLKYTSIELDVLLETLQQYTPKALYPFFFELLDEMYHRDTLALLPITAFITLLSSSRGIYGITRGLNVIYQCVESRSYLKRKFISVFYTFIFILLLIFYLFILVTGEYILYRISSISAELSSIVLVLYKLRPILALFSLTLFFLTLYITVPNRKGRFREEFPGACFSALGWMIFSFFFSFYLDYLTGQPSVYGNFTLLIGFLLWLYICTQILLIGAQINMWLKKGV